MDPRLREDDKQKTKETSKRMFGMELSTFVSRKLAARQTRTVLKFVSIIEPHHHRRHSRERGNPFIRAHRAWRWDKYSQRKTSQMPREQGECSRTINSQCTLLGLHEDHKKRRKRQAGKPFRTRKSLVRRPHIANIWPTPVGECNVMKHPVKA